MSEQNHKGIIAISTIISVGAAVITLSGIIFGFGETISSIKGDTANAKDMSATAIVKADSALLKVSNMEGKLDAIYNGLLQKGLVNKISNGK